MKLCERRVRMIRGCDIAENFDAIPTESGYSGLADREPWGLRKQQETLGTLREDQQASLDRTLDFSGRRWGRAALP